MSGRPSVVGVLLAGGQSRRMGGGDKCLRDLAGRPLLQHVIDTIAGQVGPMILNANGDPERFAGFGLPIVPDVIEGFAGPLAGVLTGLAWAARHAPDCPWILTAPTDAPFLPADLVERMLAAVEAEAADMATVSSGGRVHPVVGLWPVQLFDDLQRAVVGEGVRKVDIWTARYRQSVVDFATDPVDPFFNANRPEDLAEASRQAASMG